MEKRKTVLVVDDSATNLQLCKGLLKDEYDPEFDTWRLKSK